MPLGAANIVQQNQGNTGSSVPASTNATLPGPTTAGRTVLLVVVSDSTVGTPSGFVRDAVQVNNDGHYVFRRSNVPAGESSWTVTPTNPAATCWWVAEVSGLDLAPLDPASTSTGSSGQAASFSTGTTGTTGQADVLALASVGTSAGVNPGATSTAWTNSFVQQATTSTSKAAGTNVGLGVATRFPGAVGQFETTATTGFSAHTAALTVYKAAPPAGERDTDYAVGDPAAQWAAGGPREALYAADPAGSLAVGQPR